MANYDVEILTVAQDGGDSYTIDITGKADQTEVTSMRSEFTEEVTSLRGELEVTASSLRGELETVASSLRGEIEQAQDTFPNLTNASMSSSSMLIPQGADLDTYKTPGTYICAAGSDAATMSNVPPGVIANFKLIVNRNTGDGNPNWWGCQIVQSNDLIHIRNHQDASYGTWEQMGYTNVADTWAEFIAKAKARAEIPFTFFGNATVTNKLCDSNTKSFGTCTYTNGFLLWQLITFNDDVYSGWWKESDDSKRVYPVHWATSLATMSFEKSGITIPDNSSFTIDLSNNVPSGWLIYAVHVDVRYNDSQWYTLPYFNDAITKAMWVQRVTSNVITIRNTDSGWGTNNRILITAHMRRY